MDEFVLYEGVEGGVRGEAGGVVDLQHQRLEGLGDEDVEPQDVEAHVPGVLLGLAVSVLVAHQGRAG